MITILLSAIALSMDAFSVAICLGINKIKMRNYVTFVILVAIFHLIFPLMGIVVGEILIKISKINITYVISGIFLFLAILIMIEKEEEKILDNNISILFLSFFVSIDSFLVGIGINTLNKNYILTSICFSLFSFSFSIFGILLGNKLKLSINSFSKAISSTIFLD